ncbi:MAG: hypothetical protein ACOVSI_08280 [Gemmatimonas sp.]
MAHTPRRIVGIVVGGSVGVALAIAVTFLVRRLWPAYVLAEPTKAYTLPMLLARLTVGACCMASAAWVATRVARDTGTAAWWLGGLVLAISTWEHLARVWADYPWWYHLGYLLYLVPVAVVSGRAAARRMSGHTAPR